MEGRVIRQQRYRHHAMMVLCIQRGFLMAFSLLWIPMETFL